MALQSAQPSPALEAVHVQHSQVGADEAIHLLDYQLPVELWLLAIAERDAPLLKARAFTQGLEHR